jgi:hypothetical protein
MSKKMLGNFAIVLLILNFIACSFLTPAPTPTAADIKKEEQSVYSFFLHDSGGVALILQETSTNISEDNPEQSINFIKSGLKNISKETVDSYLARNAKPSQLSPDMKFSMEYKLLSTDELAEISSQADWGQALSEKYPDSHGYIIFSRVGFNNSLDQAVIYVGKIAGPMMGSGSYYLMEKKNGEWLLKEQVMSWIS